MKKVLIAIPTYSGMEYCLDQFLEALKKLTYDNYKILIADNSETEDYTSKIKKNGIRVIRSQRYSNPKQTIMEARNLLRKEFLKGDYDYFFSVEQDVILLPNIIQKMLSHQKDIISGVYYKFKNINGFRTYYPLLTIACDKNGNQILSNKPDCLIRDMYRHEVKENKLIQVEGSGLGCVMISRKVLEKIKFRYEKEKNAFDDMLFSIDLKKAGFKMYADTELKCKHLLEGKPNY